MKKECMGKRGIGLIEILISIVILTVVLIGAFSGFIAAGRMLHREKVKLMAAHAAEEELERLVKLGFFDSELDLGGAAVDEPVEFLTNSLPAGSLLRTRYNGQRTYTVCGKDADPEFDTDSNGDATDDIDYKEIEVNMSWDVS